VRITLPPLPFLRLFDNIKIREMGELLVCKICGKDKFFSKHTYNEHLLSQHHQLHKVEERKRKIEQKNSEKRKRRRKSMKGREEEGDGKEVEDDIEGMGGRGECNPQVDFNESGGGVGEGEMGEGVPTETKDEVELSKQEKKINKLFQFYLNTGISKANLRHLIKDVLNDDLFGGPFVCNVQSLLDQGERIQIKKVVINFCSLVCTHSFCRSTRKYIH